jgi:hypothetical protein
MSGIVQAYRQAREQQQPRTGQGEATLNFDGLRKMADQLVHDAGTIKDLAQRQQLSPLVNMLGLILADVAIMTNSTTPAVQATGCKLRKLVDEFGKHATKLRKQ